MPYVSEPRVFLSSCDRPELHAYSAQRLFTVQTDVWLVGIVSYLTLAGDDAGKAALRESWRHVSGFTSESLPVPPLEFYGRFRYIISSRLS